MAMRIAIVQLNPTIGALEDNARAITTAATRARQAGARLLVTSELSLSGYPPHDLLMHERFIADCRAALEMLARDAARDGLALLVGFPERRQSGPDKPLHNAAALLDGGRVAAIVRKRLLPTYDVFDERRYFAPGADAAKPLDLDGVKLGVHICEDAWNDRTFWKPRQYDSDPVEELVTGGAQLLINLSASPWSEGRASFRERMFANSCRRHGVPGLLVNQAGGNDDLIFDGSSTAIGARGELVLRLPSFEEGFGIADLNGSLSAVEGEAVSIWPSDVAMLRSALELGLRDYVRKCGFRDVAVGLSGGIDSALVVAIAAGALGPENVQALGMPSPYSSEGSITDSRALCANLGVRFDITPIDAAFESFQHTLAPLFGSGAPEITGENLQARIRGTLLMALSNTFGSLVLATGNKSELAVGYSTLYGDMCGGLEVIGDLPKNRVYELAREYNREREVIPHAILDKPPSAELRPNQLDTDSLPPYGVLDPILHAYIEERCSLDEIVARGYERALVARVLAMVDRAEYKRRQAPPVLRVTPRAFGAGRRMPLAQRYRHE